METRFRVSVEGVAHLFERVRPRLAMPKRLIAKRSAPFLSREYAVDHRQFWLHWLQSAARTERLRPV
jgi:hypothetical protein